ncbi:MAG TPA: glycerol kinase GlpK [Gemmatimonadaceae bacterium]|nr:glycerol kinase GlpK [Gemmatimonadaceae bacterium]
MTFVLALDQGTTGSTCLVFDETGRVVGRGYREITQYYPQPGWVEHDPVELVDQTVEAGREALATAGVAAGAVKAIGLTNQRETAVMWGRGNTRAVPRAIVWQDRRTADRCAELQSEREQIGRTTGLTVDPYFSGTKFEWLLREHGSTGMRLGTVDTWLMWNLTGGATYATDPTNASRTMLFDIGARVWSPEMGRLLGVPVSGMAEVRPSAGAFGVADPKFFGAAIPIMGVCGDQQAALFGQGCYAPGHGKVTYGTGAFLLLNTGTQRPSTRGGLLATLACDAKGQPCYAAEAAIFVAGAAIQWLRDGLGLIVTAKESESLARTVESTDGVYFVPALTGLGAPHWEPAARGTIVGLTRGTSRAHLVRAALEAMAYSTGDVLGAMRAGATIDRLRVDGGATTNDWLMQFQADVLDLPVERPDLVETTAAGAACLAGLAAGVWPTPEAFLAGRRFTTFTPGAGRAAAQAGAAGWTRAVQATLYWARIFKDA